MCEPAASHLLTTRSLTPKCRSRTFDVRRPRRLGSGYRLFGHERHTQGPRERHPCRTMCRYDATGEQAMTASTQVSDARISTDGGTPGGSARVIGLLLLAPAL